MELVARSVASWHSTSSHATARPWSHHGPAAVGDAGAVAQPDGGLQGRPGAGGGEARHGRRGVQCQTTTQSGESNAFLCISSTTSSHVDTLEIFQGIREPKSNGLCSKVPADKYKNCLPQGEDTRSFYDYHSEDIEKMTNVSFSEPEYQGKVLMVVNLASFWGYTPQYYALNALTERYADKPFKILGFPCNQFLRQVGFGLHTWHNGFKKAVLKYWVQQNIKIMFCCRSLELTPARYTLFWNTWDLGTTLSLTLRCLRSQT